MLQTGCGLAGGSPAVAIMVQTGVGLAARTRRVEKGVWAGSSVAIMVQTGCGRPAGTGYNYRTSRVRAARSGYNGTNRVRASARRRYTNRVRAGSRSGYRC